MKSRLIKLFGLTIMICCIGAFKINSYQGCYPNACGEKGEYCKMPSLKIWKEYCESTSLKDISASGVYSGVCFHVSTCPTGSISMIHKQPDSLSHIFNDDNDLIQAWAKDTGKVFPFE
jgi:hypothetical protein